MRFWSIMQSVLGFLLLALMLAGIVYLGLAASEPLRGLR